MFKTFRQAVIQSLWEIYKTHTPQMQQIESALQRKGIQHVMLDHFAIIDLPSPLSGISHLSSIFGMLGFEERGRDYLPSKQNDFLWMAEANSEDKLAQEVLPQVVVADFRLDALPTPIKTIIEKYARTLTPFPHQEAKQLLDNTLQGDVFSAHKLKHLIILYFSQQNRALPTVNEYATVREFNELLAWVLVFGRQPNHFTLSVHLLNQFLSFEDFQSFVEQEVNLPLNTQGGKTKGSIEIGIKQGSTNGLCQQVNLADGTITIPTGFVEFVWRYPLTNKRAKSNQSYKWGDFYTGFIAQQANHVIESLYLKG